MTSYSTLVRIVLSLDNEPVYILREEMTEPRYSHSVQVEVRCTSQKRLRSSYGLVATKEYQHDVSFCTQC